MKLFNLDKTVLMEIRSLEQKGNNVIIKGTILESMPITCMLTPQEAREVFKLMTWRKFLFLATLLFRR